MKTYTIGQLAKKVGMTNVTLRYYERLGLLPKTDRSFSGYRQYDDSAVAVLTFIKNAKQAGFALNEIADILKIHQQNLSSMEVKQRVGRKLEEIEKKILQLQLLKQNLEGLVALCDAQRPAQECPIAKKLFDA